MKKVMKLCSIILFMLAIFILSGCELSIEDIKEKYDVNNEIQGEEITEEELLEKFENILKDYEQINYAEILREGNFGGEEASVKLQYDFSSDDIKDFKFYLSLISPEEQMTAFIDKEILYVESKYKDDVIKEKAKLTDVLDDINAEDAKEELLEEAMSSFGMDLGLNKESYEDLIDTLKEELFNNQDRTKFQVDSEENLIIDYTVNSGQGRIVFNKNNKLIYIGIKGGNIYTTLTIDYNKPNIKIPSKDGYQEAEIE